MSTSRFELQEMEVRMEEASFRQEEIFSQEIARMEALPVVKSNGGSKSKLLRHAMTVRRLSQVHERKRRA